MADRILITGGAGFIGSHLALSLADRGQQVTVLDNLSPQVHGESPENSYSFCSIKDRVNFIHGDVLNEADWRKALEDQDIVDLRKDFWEHSIWKTEEYPLPVAIIIPNSY